MKLGMRIKLLFFISVLLLICGYLSQKEPADAQIHSFSDDSVLPGSMQWEFAKKFTKDAVYPNGKLNPEMITYGNFIDETAAIQYVKTKASPAVQSASKTSVVTGLSDEIPSRLPYICYHNVGSVELDGKQVPIDIRVTLKSWKVKEGSAKKNAFIQFATCVEASSSVSPDYPHDLQAIGIWPSRNVEYIDLKYEYYYAGTEQTVAFDGFFSFVDLDYLQYVQLDESSNIDRILRAPNQNLIRSDQADHISIQEANGKTVVQSSNCGINPNDTVDDRDAKKSYYQKDSYLSGYLTFSFKKQHTIQFRFGTSSGYESDFMANTTSLKHYYYGILPYSISSCQAPVPQKYIYQEENGLVQEMLLNQGDRTVRYIAEVFVPRSLQKSCNYNYFSFQDSLSKIYDCSKLCSNVKVFQDSLDGNEVTEWFQSTVNEKNILTVTANSATISEQIGREFFGHRYYLSFSVEIPFSCTEKEFRNTGILQNANAQYIIPNSIQCITGVFHPYENQGNGAYIREVSNSNTVTVLYSRPQLSIQKQVNGKAFAMVSEDEVVHYEIVAEQTEPGAVAENVQIIDNSLKNCKELQIIEDSLHAYLASGETKKEIGVTLNENQLQLDRFDNAVTKGKQQLAYGQKILICFDASARKATEKEGITNTVTLTANGNISIQAKATVSVQNPKLYIEKYVEKLSGSEGNYFKVGDEVLYKILLYNSSDQITAKDLVLKDSWTEGMTLTGTDEAHGFSIFYHEKQGLPDHTEMLTKLTLGRDYSIKEVNSEKGFMILFHGKYKDLDNKGAYLITYQTKITGTGKNYIINNTAAADASNAKEVFATAGIDTLGNPGIELKKEVDKQELALGDTISYTVTLVNDGGEPLAPLTMQDLSMNQRKGFELQEINASFYFPENGRWIDLPLQTETEGMLIRQVKNGWTFEIYNSLAGNLPVGAKICIQTCYKTNRTCAIGSCITNQVLAEATGLKTGSVVKAEDTADVFVVQPELVISKQSDRSAYAVGDVGNYTLTIEQKEDQVRKDLTAHHIIVNDLLDSATYSSATNNKKIKSVIKVDRSGKETDVTNTCQFGYSYSIEGTEINELSVKRGSMPENSIERRRMVGIATGQSLDYGEKLVITYQVIFDESMTFSGESVNNTASTQGVNTEEVTTRLGVEIQAPVLSIVKSAEHDLYGIGERAVYTITIKQTEDAVAENICLRDVFDRTDRICFSQIDHLKVFDQNGRLLLSEEPEDGYADYEIKKYRDPESRENGYLLMFQNPLRQNESYTIVYEVSLKEKGKLKNTATVTATNCEEATDCAEIEVLQPELTVEKKSKQTIYYTDEEVEYIVDVVNINPIGVSHPVVTDTLPQGIMLEPTSMQVLIIDREGNERQSVDFETTMEKNTWTVKCPYLESGCGIRILFDAKVLEEATGKTLENSVQAWGDYTDRVISSCQITVRSKYTIMATKKLRASDINFATGDPIFIWNLSGKDENGSFISLHRMIRFTKEYVEQNLDSQGYVSIQTTFEKLMPGKYEISEQESMRYRLQTIESSSAGVTIKENSVLLDTGQMGTSNTAAVVFVNEKYEEQFFTHTDAVTNRLQNGKEAKTE